MDQEKKEETNEENNQLDQQTNDTADTIQTTEEPKISDTSETFESDVAPESPESISDTTEVVAEQSNEYNETSRPTEIQELAEKDESEPIDLPLIEDVKPYEAPKSDDSVKVDETSQTADESKTDQLSAVSQPKVDDAAPSTTVEDVKPAKKGYPIQLAIIILVVWSVMTAAGAYLLRDRIAVDMESQKDAMILDLQNQLNAKSSEDNSSSTTTTTDGVSPSATVAANIKASITSGNTAALEGYMASIVSVVTAASDDSAPADVSSKTAAAAVTSITDFIDSATSPWNFALSSSVLNTYETSNNYGEYFTSIAIVGKSANSQVISFSFDSAGKINTVFLADSGISL